MMEKWMKDDEVQGSVLGGFTGRRAVCVCVSSGGPVVDSRDAQLCVGGRRADFLYRDYRDGLVFFFSCSLICM